MKNTVHDSGKLHFQTKTLRPRLSEVRPSSTHDSRDHPGRGRPVGRGGRGAGRVTAGSVMSQPGKGCPPPLLTPYCPLPSHRAPATCKEGWKHVPGVRCGDYLLSPSTPHLSGQQTSFSLITAYIKCPQPYSQETSPKSSLL